MEAAAIPPTALACLIYTSGTGGAPKGVMLPHRSILSNCRGAFELLRPLRLKDEVYLSYLPISHSYEHTVGQFFLPSIGTEIVYARGVEHLAADLLTVRPTILTAVPRVLEVIRSRVLAQVARANTAGVRRCSTAPWRSACKRVDRAPLTLVEDLLDPAAGPAGARQGARPLRRPADARRCRAARGWNPRWDASSWPSG